MIRNHDEKMQLVSEHGFVTLLEAAEQGCGNKVSALEKSKAEKHWIARNRAIHAILCEALKEARAAYKGIIWAMVASLASVAAPLALASSAHAWSCAGGVCTGPGWAATGVGNMTGAGEDYIPPRPIIVVPQQRPQYRPCDAYCQQLQSDRQLGIPNSGQ